MNTCDNPVSNALAGVLKGFEQSNLRVVRLKIAAVAFKALLREAWPDAVDLPRGRWTEHDISGFIETGAVPEFSFMGIPLAVTA